MKIVDNDDDCDDYTLLGDDDDDCDKNADDLLFPPGVCVKPLHFHYNKTLELLQFIEMNRILGVTK